MGRKKALLGQKGQIDSASFVFSNFLRISPKTHIFGYAIVLTPSRYCVSDFNSRVVNIMSFSLEVTKKHNQNFVQLNKNYTTTREKESIPFVSKSIVLKRTNNTNVYHGSNKFSEVNRNSYAVFASRNIFPGQCVWSENPFISYSSIWPVAQQYECISTQMAACTRKQKSDLSLFRSLEVPPQFISPEVKDIDIVAYNSIKYNKHNQGVFLLMAATRYSCCPNVEVSILKPGVVVAYATRLIMKGTEITRGWTEDLNISFLQRQVEFSQLFKLF